MRGLSNWRHLSKHILPVRGPRSPAAWICDGQMSHWDEEVPLDLP